MDKRAIGVFDSGVGGLTVLKQIKKYLPNESIIYLGDTKHLPYGDKSKEAIIRFSVENTKFLIKNDVKAIVVACNSASSVAIEPLKEMFKIPIIGVIEPTVEYLQRQQSKKVLIIGTIRTITSGMYERKIKESNKGVFSKACPLFVPLIEEGAFINKDSYLHKALEISITHYLEEFRNKIDTLILGCTHYPLIAKELQEYMGDNVKLIDPGECTAIKLKEILEENNLLSNSTASFEKYFVTDLSERIKQVVSYIMGDEINIEEVYISDF